jgi:DNA-binding winged helix-turn-helix (wHTH) protein
VAERELRRDGELIALTAKTFDLLLLLVRGAGRTFTKSELMESLWSSTTVEESNLSQTIFLLRKALGENGEGSEYIFTVPRRGYKFIGSVSRQPAAGNGVGPEQALTIPSRPSHVWPAIAALAILALAALAFVHFREAAPEARVVRSNMLLPEDTRYTDGTLALSPDGRRIAFAATQKIARAWCGFGRWMRKALTPWEEPTARMPFWSPDSRWLGFFADGKLKKIDTQGGPPIALADAPVPLGGSWSPNDVILFSSNNDALQQVSANGGKAVPTAVAAVIGGTQCCPWFLPDGEHYLFSSHTVTGAGSGVNLLVGSLSSTATKVVGDAGKAVYAQGRLLYLKESTLVAQPFDIKALRTIGEPEAVVDGVGHYRNTFQEGFLRHPLPGCWRILRRLVSMGVN